MSPDEILVGAIALILAAIALAFAIGPWDAPYQLRMLAAVASRLGKPAARGVWIVIALALFTAGMAILNGLRPSYAQPAEDSRVE